MTEQWRRDARQLLNDVDMKGKFRDPWAWMQEAVRLLQLGIEGEAVMRGLGTINAGPWDCSDEELRTRMEREAIERS